MPTRKLTTDELARAQTLLAQIRGSLGDLSKGDSELLFAYRRKVAKELNYDERSKPSERRALKLRKFRSQEGKCVRCGRALGPKGRDAVLDRTVASAGYTEANVRLICHGCDVTTQREREYRG